MDGVVFDGGGWCTVGRSHSCARAQLAQVVTAVLPAANWQQLAATSPHSFTILVIDPHSTPCLVGEPHSLQLPANTLGRNLICCENHHKQQKTVHHVAKAAGVRLHNHNDELCGCTEASGAHFICYRARYCVRYCVRYGRCCTQDTQPDPPPPASRSVCLSLLLKLQTLHSGIRLGHIQALGAPARQALLARGE